MIFRRARVNYLFKTCKIFGVNESYKNKIIHCFFSFPLQLIRKILLYRFYCIFRMEIKIKKDETYYTFNIVEITFTYLVS